jgi:Zn-finger nucleic acid-binding protein
MQEITYESVQVDRCPNCKGIWFEQFEKEKLKALRGSESVDIGDRAKGTKYSQVNEIDCPVCHTRMTKMVDVKQSHIWYESCPVCYGVFFDAGEFRDYKKESWFDFFKTLVTKERK